MRFESSSFGALLKPVDRRAFKASVERHDGDRYDKSFSSWDHLVSLVYAQAAGASSLRELVLDWNAHSHRHYHLGSDLLSRSTLSDANARRPWQVFAETMTGLAAQCSGKAGRESREMLRIIDSTPIPLGDLYDCGASNGRIDGLKMHVVYDPLAQRPLTAEVTKANVNDVEIGCGVELAPDTTGACPREGGGLRQGLLQLPMVTPNRWYWWVFRHPPEVQHEVAHAPPPRRRRRRGGLRLQDPAPCRSQAGEQG